MDTPHDIPVRSARDRIIDLLEIGDTYPLTDLNVVADQLKVAFGGTAKIPIENAQANVTYQLCDPAGTPLGKKFEADGEDATLVIETPAVADDVTYRIRARKKPSGSTLPAQTFRFLDESAPVKVGIDTRLALEILDAPLLDTANPNPQPSDPRIVPYGTSVNVRVKKSQEGVQYSLMLGGRDVNNFVTGDLKDIVLVTGPMLEDAVIQVRATKNFLAFEDRKPETAPLDAKLYLKVRANPALAVSVDAAPIVDFRQDATIRIANTQASAKYQAYARAIADADFVRSAGADGDVVKVAVAGKPDVQVRKPARSESPGTPKGYVAIGDGAVPGTGGDLKLTVKTLADDAMVIVQALKAHRVDPDAATTIASSICLDQAAVVLVRPDPTRSLRLRLPVAGAQTGDSMQVSDGQPGVFYYFRPAPAGAEFPLPAYFHKRDAQNATLNKGVGQLGVEIDFAVAADADARAAGAAANTATVFPRAPLLGITPVASGSSLSSRAVKAQTAVEANMVQSALIAAVPAISADPAIVESGGTSKIVISASNPEDQYQVTFNGTPVKSAVTGNGTDVTVITDPIGADALFEVVVTRPGDEGMRVERVVQVPVTIKSQA